MDRGTIPLIVKSRLTGEETRFGEMTEAITKESDPSVLKECAKLLRQTLREPEIISAPKEAVLDVVSLFYFAESASSSFSVQKGKRHLQTSTLSRLEEEVTEFHSFDTKKDEWIVLTPIDREQERRLVYTDMMREKLEALENSPQVEYHREWYSLRDRKNELLRALHETGFQGDMEEFVRHWNYSLRFKRFDKKMKEFFSGATMLILVDEIISLLQDLQKMDEVQPLVKSTILLLAQECVLDLQELIQTFATQQQLWSIGKEELEMMAEYVKKKRVELLRVSQGIQDAIQNISILEVATSATDLVSSVLGMLLGTISQIKQAESIEKIALDVKALRSEMQYAVRMMRSLHMQNLYMHIASTRMHVAGLRAIGDILDYQTSRMFFADMRFPRFNSSFQKHLTMSA